jgi:hypothetical protein
MMGVTLRQGPHHGAHMSTNTGSGERSIFGFVLAGQQGLGREIVFHVGKGSQDSLTVISDHLLVSCLRET